MEASQPTQQEVSEGKVFICGISAAYPTTTIDDKFLESVTSRAGIRSHEQISKLLAINKRTGIRSRPVILDHNHIFYQATEPLKVETLTKIWLEHGIPLSYRACLSAIKDWGGNSNEITHLIAATCSVQCHPGIDAYIANKLNLQVNVSRTLLSGVGCAGGAAALRTAYEFAIAMTYRRKAARILVVVCDLNSLAARSDLEQLNRGVFPIGLTLFSDAATAAVISNDIALGSQETTCYPFEIKQWVHHTIPNSLNELMLMPTSIGLVSTISKNLPKLIANAIREMFFQLLSSMPKCIGKNGKEYRDPCDFDWDIHPGGVGVFESIIEVMGLTKKNTRATVETYENWGNSAGPTILKVLEVSKSLPTKREFVVCCGFGNNIDITMLILRRC